MIFLKKLMKKYNNYLFFKKLAKIFYFFKNLPEETKNSAKRS